MFEAIYTRLHETAEIKPGLTHGYSHDYIYLYQRDNTY